MSDEASREPLIRALRSVYRMVPGGDAFKLRAIDALGHWLPGLRTLTRQAREQVERELAAVRKAKARTVAAPAAPIVPGPGSAERITVEGHPHRTRRIHARTRAIGYVPHAGEALPAALPARIVAFYLPQFHPIAVNDRAWGAGFTEWTNVTRALPQVEGQVQPRLPGELGFYDLRIPSVQVRQVELAKQYGIGGFCFHFYWFGGERLLEMPLQQYVANPDCDLPFCLCWANENWTKRWDGLEEDVLVAQHHSPADDIAFIDNVSVYFRDPRYIRINGSPLLIVYRPTLLPDPQATARRWRARCRENGIGEIYLALTTAFDRHDPSRIGFDGVVEFAPNNSSPSVITRRVRTTNPSFNGSVFDWRCLVRQSWDYESAAYPLFRGVNPGWDNTPRKPEAGNIFLHASPRGYEEWLANALRDTVRRFPDPDHRLVFLNAWNEWAEGAYMEPDARLGYAYLAANRRALQRVAEELAGSPAARETPTSICVVIHAFYPELLDEMLDRIAGWDRAARLIVTTTAEREDEVRALLRARGVDAECRVFENRGRDILPFLHVANELADAGERLVVKLHTKRSPHRVDGDTWRQDLLDKLIAPDNARRILDAFDEHAELGMVAPEGHILPMPFYWGSNEANVHYLCRRMGIAEVDPENEVFPAGSMFWCRVDALRPLLDTHLDEAEFEAERGQLDGTMPHAIERVLGLSAGAAGLYLASSTSPDARAAPLEQEYGYAESSRAAGPAAG
jgi:lipopolysaccharide biosynthesis protein